MQAAVLKATRSIAVEERPIPRVKAGDDVLVRIRAAGICGSDLHGFQGLSPDKRSVGLVMGHENAGEVVKTGEEVSAVKVGDRVAVDPQLSCGKCKECTKGCPNICNNMKLLGSSARGPFDGGLTEYVAVPERNLHLLPKNLGFEEGAMIDPVTNAVHLLNRARVKIGDTIAIFGAAALGLSLLQMAKIAGARAMFITDISPYRLRVAESLGADFPINVQEHDPVELILKKTQDNKVLLFLVRSKR